MTDLEKFFTLMWQACRNYETDLLAHVEVLKAIRAASPELAEQVDRTLEAARNHPSLAEAMRQKYDVSLEAWLHQEPLIVQMREAVRTFEVPQSPEKKYPQ